MIAVSISLILAASIAAGAAWATAVKAKSSVAPSGAPFTSFDAPGLTGADVTNQDLGRFSTAADAGALHAGCGEFGVAANCLDAMRTKGAANDDFEAAKIPEPSSALLCGLGLMGLAWIERRFAPRT